jgi:DNA-binding NarL/FixJ family response regulator
MKRVIVADKQAIRRAGFRHLLGELYTDRYVEEAAEPAELIRTLDSGEWDLVIIDLEMILRNHRWVLDEVRERAPRMPIIVTSSFADSQWIRRCIPTWVATHLNKGCSLNEMRDVISRTLNGGWNGGSLGREGRRNERKPPYAETPRRLSLSHRELQLLTELASGERLSATANRLKISASAASTYRRRLMQKMGFKCNADITCFALSLGMNPISRSILNEPGDPVASRPPRAALLVPGRAHG